MMLLARNFLPSDISLGEMKNYEITYSNSNDVISKEFLGSRHQSLRDKKYVFLHLVFQSNSSIAYAGLPTFQTPIAN